MITLLTLSTKMYHEQPSSLKVSLTLTVKTHSLRTSTNSQTLQSTQSQCPAEKDL
jgi:hypothetical protein